MKAEFHVLEQVAIINYAVARRNYRRLNRVPTTGIRIIIGGFSYHLYDLLFKDWPVLGTPTKVPSSKPERASGKSKKKPSPLLPADQELLHTRPLASQRRGNV